MMVYDWCFFWGEILFAQKLGGNISGGTKTRTPNISSQEIADHAPGVG